MKKNILAYAALLAGVVLAASCNKGELVSEAVEENATVKALAIEAKLSSASGEGMKTVIAADDILRVRFADASGAKVGRTQTLVNTSGEGKTATFSAEKISVPNDAATVYAYLDNQATSQVNYASMPTKDDFSNQDGTLDCAIAKQVIMGKSALSGSNASVDLSYKTGIVKAVLSFPEEATPIDGETTVTLACSQYNVMDIVLDETASSSKGDITVNAKVDGNKAVAYIAVWADDLKNGSIFSNIQSTKYGCDYDVDQISAGKTVVAEKSVETLVYNFFIPDEEYKIEGVRGSLASADDCITLAGGVITVAENKTGKVRNSKITLDNGKTYQFTQMGANEFKGSWTFKAKYFSNNTSIVKAGNNSTSLLTIGDPIGGIETLEDFDGVKHTNNLGITGFYDTAVMNACVEIDYDTHSIKFGLFLDARTAQKVSKSNINGYPYVCFLPEMGTATNPSANWTSPWNFVQADLDTQKDYCWIWFSVSEDMNEFTWNSFSDKQYMNGDLKTSANCIIGITCAVCKSEVASKANVYGTYNVIYQGNTNNDNIVPVSITRN